MVTCAHVLTYHISQLIKAHPWFKPIDWKLLLEKEIPPPYIPPVKSKEDMGMIADEFKRQTVSIKVRVCVCCACLCVYVWCMYM